MSIPWKLPVILSLGCGLAGFIAATVLPHWYKVVTTLYFPTAGSSDSAASIIGKVVGNGVSNGGNPVSDVGSVSLLGGMFQQPQLASGSDTAIAILDSTKCKEAVAKDLNLGELWHMKKKKDIYDTLGQIVSYGVDKNNLLDLEVDNTDPKLALQISNSYLKNLKEISIQMSTAYSHRNRLFIESELAKQRALVDVQEQQLVDMQTSGGLKTISSSADDRITSALVDLQQRSVTAQIALNAANKQIDSILNAANITAKNSTELPREMPVAQDTRAKLRDLEAKFEYDKATLGPDNPQYNADKTELETMKAQMNAEVHREVTALKEGITPEVATLFANRASLQAQRDGLVDATKRTLTLLKSIPAPQMAAAKLQSDIKVSGGTMGMLAAEAEKARIAEQRDMTVYMVMDEPELPEDPFKPRRSTTTFISMAAGFLIGCAWLVGGTLRRSAIFKMSTLPAEPETED